jgi:hypothetical protein
MRLLLPGAPAGRFDLEVVHACPRLSTFLIKLISCS